jgi:predicted nucleic acid-binding Zn ribbon protein
MLPRVEIILDTNNIRTIEDTSCLDKIDQIYNKFIRWVSNNCRIISCLIFVLIVIGVILSVILSQNSNIFPCSSYSDQTLASSVTIKCLQYLWEVSGCIKNGKPPIPDNYNGFYLRSPAGLSYVRCDNIYYGNNCGVGNYRALVNSVQQCNLNFN